MATVVHLISGSWEPSDYSGLAGRARPDRRLARGGGSTGLLIWRAGSAGLLSYEVVWASTLLKRRFLRLIRERMLRMIGASFSGPQFIR